MNLRSLLQDILKEVSSRIISFQMRLHLLITLIRSSEYFRFIESLRTCIMASHYIQFSTIVSVFNFRYGYFYNLLIVWNIFSLENSKKIPTLTVTSFFFVSSTRNVHFLCIKAIDAHLPTFTICT